MARPRCRLQGDGENRNLLQENADTARDQEARRVTRKGLDGFAVVDYPCLQIILFYKP